MIKYLLAHSSSPTGLLQSPPHHRIMTSRKQPISLENEKHPLSLLVPQHNLPPLPLALTPSLFYSLLPDPITSPGPCLKGKLPDMIYRPRDAKVRAQIVLQASPKPLCGAGDSNPDGQFTGYGTEFATSGTKWYRISITREAKQSLFSPRPVTQARDL